MAQFFDLPDVRSAARSYTGLELSARDEHAARLFAAWMRARLRGSDHLAVSIRSTADRDGVISSAVVRGGEQQLALRLLPNRTCVETTISRGDAPHTVRIVPAGDSSYATLLAQELRVRSRDVAFEEALDEVHTL
jgi:hypothetical protein